MRRDSFGQQADQRFVLEVVLIGDVEAHDPLVPVHILEPLPNHISLTSFHHEDEFGPLQELARHRDDGVCANSGSFYLEARVIAIDCSGSRAPQPVLVTQEEDP